MAPPVVRLARQERTLPEQAILTITLANRVLICMPAPTIPAPPARQQGSAQGLIPPLAMRDIT